jgi:hypothetical protein
MFTAEQYRAKAGEYAELLKQASDPGEKAELQKLQNSLQSLADNEAWLADNFDKTVTEEADEVGKTTPAAQNTALAGEEERILRCLGAAVIMHWSAIPTKLQRELFDSAGSVGDLLRTAELRGQIARFLHKHNADGGALR